MESKKICSLSIDYNVVGDGLVGGKYEYKPYMAWHATFGRYMIKEIDRLEFIRAPAIMPFAARRPHRKGTRATEGAEDNEGEAEIFMDSKVESYRSTKPIVLELLDYDQMRGDNTIHFKLFSHTDYSGVDSIDKTEAGNVDRQIQSGCAQLELSDVFKFLRASGETGPVVTFEVDALLEDQKVIDEKARELLRSSRNNRPSEQDINDVLTRAKPLVERARITYIITVRDFRDDLFKQSIFGVEGLKLNHLHAKLPLSSRRTLNASTSSSSSTRMGRMQGRERRRYEPLLFNSERTWSLFVRAMGGVLNKYSENFMDDEESGLSCLYKPCDPVVSNLQFPQYLSEFGKLPVYAYWSQDPFYREYACEEDRDEVMKLYGFRDKAESYLLLMFRSALRRHGMKESTFIRVVNEHFSPSNTSTSPDRDFLRVEEIAGDLGTSVANMADYTADYRFMAAIESLQGKHRDKPHKDMRELRECSVCGKMKRIKVKVISLDSWDNVILNNTSSCDDCEGQDCTASTVLRAYKIGRYDLGYTWESEALCALQKLLKHTVIIDDAALVTSAFMDTNNKKIESKQDDLCLIGSEMDKNAQNDGHCFGMTQSLLRTIGQLERGNVSKDVIERLREASKIGGTKAQEDNFRLRDGKRKTLVLEPTGSIEPRLLPIAESYSSENCEDPGERLFKKNKAIMCFMKQLRTLLKEAEKDKVSIVDLFVGEGLPHYVEKQVAQRRTSSFYSSVVHGSSVDLMQFDSSLSQFAFCKNNRYGVRMGELIRDTKSSNLSIVCPYVSYAERWEKEVRPMVESIMSQMPIMKFARYTDEEYANEIYSRYISPQEMCAKFDFDSASAYGSAESKKAQLKFETLLEEVDSLESNKVVVRLFSRVWKLKDCPLRTEKLNRFIRSLPGLVDYGYYVERYIPVCQPVVEILLIVDVSACLELNVEIK